MELNEKALEYLKTFGITPETLKDLNDGNKEKAEKAKNDFVSKIKEKNKEELLAELKDDHKEELANAVKDAQIGSQKAAKNKIVDFAKKQGIPVQKSDVESLDLNDTISLISDKFAENKEKGSGDDKSGEIQRLSTQIDELAKQNAEYKAAIEAHPKQIEAQTKKVLDGVLIDQTVNSIFESYKGKTHSVLFENEATKKGIKRELQEYIQAKGAQFFVEEINGKKTVIPKKQLKDRNGNLTENFAPLEQTATTNHSPETLIQEFFESNKLIIQQAEGYTAQTVPQNTPNSGDRYNPYTARVD